MMGERGKMGVPERADTTGQTDVTKRAGVTTLADTAERTDVTERAGVTTRADTAERAPRTVGERAPRSEGTYRLILLGVAIIWGSSFFIMKGAITLLPINFLLAVRFIVGALFVGLVFIRRVIACWSWEYIWRGLLLGVILFLAYFFQTYGLSDTTPGKNAFITAGYVVLVPFMFWALGHPRPDRFSVIAAVLLLVGVGFISLEGDLSIRYGDWMTMICAVLYAMQMVGVAHFVEGRDAAALTFYQNLGAGICALLVSLVFESAPPAGIWSPGLIASVAYLSIVVTGLTFLGQSVGQKHVEPSVASVLLSLECVFGVLFSMVFYGETLTAKVLTGFILVFVAVIISETKLSFLRARRGA